MQEEINGFQHDPELFLVDGIPRYITSGNTYRDKLKNGVALDTVLLLDNLSIYSISMCNPINNLPSVIEQNNKLYADINVNVNDNDDGVRCIHKKHNTKNAKLGIKRKLKKPNTQIRNKDLYKKYSEINTNTDVDDYTIHSVEYNMRELEMLNEMEMNRMEWLFSNDRWSDIYH